MVTFTRDPDLAPDPWCIGGSPSRSALQSGIGFKARDTIAHKLDDALIVCIVVVFRVRVKGDTIFFGVLRRRTPRARYGRR